MKLKLFAALAVGSSLLLAESDAPKRLEAAASIFKEVMGIPDKSIPQDLMNKAYCIIIIPNLKKGAFIIGGKYGKGFVSCRKTSGVGWTAPGSMRIEGGSIGLQIGGAEADIFMLIMNDKGMNRLLKSKFTLGGDATVAAGPVGRSSQAETGAGMPAGVLPWSRSAGLVGGTRATRRTRAQRPAWKTQLHRRRV